MIEVCQDSGSTLDQITASLEARDEQQPQIFDSVKKEQTEPIHGEQGCYFVPMCQMC